MSLHRRVPGEGIELPTVKETAAKLRVSTATVYSLVDCGELAHVRVMNPIRITEAELQTYLKRQHP